jgi:hypothetical protein
VASTVGRRDVEAPAGFAGNVERGFGLLIRRTSKRAVPCDASPPRSLLCGCSCCRAWRGATSFCRSAFGREDSNALHPADSRGPPLAMTKGWHLSSVQFPCHSAKTDKPDVHSTDRATSRFGKFFADIAITSVLPCPCTRYVRRFGQPHEPVGPFGLALVSPTHWIYPHAIAPPAKAKGGAVHC